MKLKTHMFVLLTIGLALGSSIAQAHPEIGDIDDDGENDIEELGSGAPASAADHDDDGDLDVTDDDDDNDGVDDEQDVAGEDHDNDGRSDADDADDDSDGINEDQEDESSERTGESTGGDGEQP